MKKTTAFILALVLLLTASLPAFADTMSAPPADQISDDPNHAEFIWRAPILTRDVITEKKIIYTHTGISKLSSTSVSITALTDTTEEANVIFMNMVVQQWKNNKWNNYATSNFSKENTASYRATTTKSVEPNYYYRLAVTHYASFIDGTVSSYNTYTKSIYVN